jgi:hypothetical protein
MSGSFIRPRTLVDDEKGAQKTPPETRCCQPAPAVLQFAPDGRLLKSWVVRPRRLRVAEERARLHVDKEGNVWVGGNDKDDQILKFTPDGKFLLQIGKADSTSGSNSTTRLGRPAHMVTDDATGELYVADGYGKPPRHRVRRQDGAYKRHWGGYGTKTPTDDKLPPYQPVPITGLSKSFSNPVHCVRLRAMVWSTCAIGPTIEFRSSRRTASS